MLPLLLFCVLAVPPERIVFDEPGFPAIGVAATLPEVDGARSVGSVAALEAALVPGEVILVWRHGDAFPADAWGPFLRFLEGGGSFLWLGGAPLDRPVTGAPGERVVRAPNVNLRKALRLNQARRLALPAGTIVLRAETAEATRKLDSPTRVTVLEPRLTDARDFPDEDGSPGAREAICRPLLHAVAPDGDPRFPDAALAVAFDRIAGRFAGGRWVFWLANAAPTTDELTQLIEQASRPASDLRVVPTVGCFHEEETPAVRLRLVRPGVRGPAAAVDIMVTAEDGTSWTARGDVSGSESGAVETEIALEGPSAPGLYRVTARSDGHADATTGFWIVDRHLLATGDELTFDTYTLRRNGVPTPVIGTTVMSSTVHRDFLFEPDAAVWDRTFGDLAAQGMTVVRTGVWSGWSRFVTDDGVVDEAWLRALEAYLLSARRHGVVVVFTFFAFVPHRFGGDCPYFDPVALAGQREFLRTVAERFSGAKEVIWDLINEPSFASPDKLWRCRPHGCAHEAAAFQGWLEARYGRGGADWEAEVRDRWRLTPDEPIGLPTDADFEDAQVFGDARPFRAKEWIHFAQDAFRGWIVAMRRALTEGGSLAPVTVGQDEGGLNERPSPLYHHDAVDFTSMHTWWYNDAQLWDVVMAKARAKPLLVSETGVMNRELLTGEAVRSERDTALLLSRKIAAAFAGGAFGVVHWCRDVNPYMDSDNEVAIGTRRVDGSDKPERRVLAEFARFVSKNGRRLDGFVEPDVALVMPFADHWPPRGMQADGTRRIVAEAEGPIRVVAEHRALADLGRPRVIVLPSCRGIADDAWIAIERAVAEGATLRCSGFFERDDAGRPALRIGALRQALALVDEDAEGRPLPMPLLPSESWFRASSSTHPHALERIVHRDAPLDWALARPRDDDGLLVRTHRFARLGGAAVTLAAVVNERSGPAVVRGESIPARTGALLLFDEGGALIDRTRVEGLK